MHLSAESEHNGKNKMPAALRINHLPPDMSDQFVAVL